MTIETHPLEPFLPQDASILFLGSFPPPRARWSMDFFYPNFNNDFWRVMGLVHFSDAQHFVAPAGKKFNYEAVVDFCRAAGLAFFDTASQVRRLKDNASDAFLEVLQPTDVGALLTRLPRCRTIVTTGGKASEELAALLRSESPSTLVIPGSTGNLPASPVIPSPTGNLPASPVIPGPTGNLPAAPISIPAPGTSLDVSAWGRTLRWWRMPSTSRAYPLSLTAKAAAYSRLWP